jgi:hypothetical protein
LRAGSDLWKETDSGDGEHLTPDFLVDSAQKAQKALPKAACRSGSEELTGRRASVLDSKTSPRSELPSPPKMLPV